MARQAKRVGAQEPLLTRQGIAAILQQTMRGRKQRRALGILDQRLREERRAEARRSPVSEAATSCISPTVGIGHAIAVAAAIRLAVMGIERIDEGSVAGMGIKPLAPCMPKVSQPASIVPIT